MCSCNLPLTLCCVCPLCSYVYMYCAVNWIELIQLLLQSLLLLLPLLLLLILRWYKLSCFRILCAIYSLTSSHPAVGLCSEWPRKYWADWNSVRYGRRVAGSWECVGRVRRRNPAEAGWAEVGRGWKPNDRCVCVCVCVSVCLCVSVCVTPST
jgi:hypothetical protein